MKKIIKASPKATKSAAILTLHSVSKMTPAGRKAIVKWLKQQIVNVEKHHKELSDRFTARYLY